MPASDDKNDDGPIDLGDAVDMVTFGQILEMDEDEQDREFSQSIVAGFFDQAKETIDNMNTALQDEDLKKLSELGHFLKGSSATLGLVKVRDSCEKIQRYGKKEKLDGSSEPDTQKCLRLIKAELPVLSADYEAVEETLKKFFHMSET